MNCNLNHTIAATASSYRLVDNGTVRQKKGDIFVIPLLQRNQQRRIPSLHHRDSKWIIKLILIPSEACMQLGFKYLRSHIDICTVGNKNRNRFIQPVASSHHQSCISVLLIAVNKHINNAILVSTITTIVQLPPQPY